MSATRPDDSAGRSEVKRGSARSTVLDEVLSSRYDETWFSVVLLLLTRHGIYLRRAGGRRRLSDYWSRIIRPMRFLRTTVRTKRA